MMDSFSKASISRGSLSRFFQGTVSGPGASSAETSNNNIGAKALRALFKKDSNFSGKGSFERNSSPPSPPSPTLPSPSSSEFPDRTTIRSPLHTLSIPEIQNPLVSVWESDTEDEEEPPSFRERIRTQMNKLKKKKKDNKKRDKTLSVPSTETESAPGSESTLGSESALESDSAPESERESETHTQRESRKPRALRVVFGTPIPSRVFGRNIPYEITIAGQVKPEPTRTFSHFRKLPCKYSRPAANEVLHIREDDYECLTLERINGATRITSGTLQCLTAELAHPLFAKHDSSTLFENMIFCGTMLVGNAKLLEMLFRQIKNCTGKPEQQLNIIHFLVHWMQEKPEDFSWDEETLELRNQIFGYLLAIFRQTELAKTLWRLSVKHEEANNSYMDFVRSQKKGWVPFEDVMKVYARHTDCSLIEDGLSNIDADDLAHYMAAIDLILFRDGSEISALEQYWDEITHQKTLKKSNTNWAGRARESPWWIAARVNRLLIRIKMIKHWVSLEILQINTIEGRARMIQTFVTVAGNLWEMGDFHGCHCIMQGLESPLIHSLTCTWEEVGTRYHVRCEQLQEFLYDRAVYDEHLKKSSQEPVIPYYGYFIEEVTKIHNEKDHVGRLRSTNTGKFHRDMSLRGFGVWDTLENRAPRPVSKDSHSQQSTSLDLKKYWNILETVDGHRERAKPDYWFGGEITRESFVLRLHLLGMNNFAALRDLENSAATGHKGRLNPTSRLVETRILEAWGLIPETDIPDVFCDEDTLRTVVLQKLLMATGE